MGLLFGLIDDILGLGLVVINGWLLGIVHGVNDYLQVSKHTRPDRLINSD